MAEALLRDMGESRFEVYSAGLEPTVIHPMTIKVLQEIGIDASRQYAKPLTDFIGKVQFDYLITVCSNADERCPMFPGSGQRLHWPFDDPAAFKGSEEARLDFFRQTRDQIKLKIEQWLTEQNS
jgi:arsenate reductase